MHRASRFNIIGGLRFDEITTHKLMLAQRVAETRKSAALYSNIPQFNFQTARPLDSRGEFWSTKARTRAAILARFLTDFPF
jgi:hypothetical protein